MTKYEWESELKKNIHRLPADEISRVLEYYDELFADKIERGYNEYEIIGQFGNPVDVADKILSEYDGELPETTVPTPAFTPLPRENAAAVQDAPTERPVPQEKTAEETHNEPTRTPDAPAPVAADEKPAAKPQKKYGAPRGERIAIIALINLFTGFVPLIVVGTVWIVTAALVVSGVVCAVGGVAGAFWSIATVFRGALGAGVAQIGISLGVCGAGVLLTVACIWGIRLLHMVTAWGFRVVKRWVCPVEKAEVQA